METFVDLFELVLRETKLIVCDSNLALLSAAVLAFAPVLQPLQWMGIFIPVLPDKLLAFVEAPVPFLVYARAPHHRDSLEQHTHCSFGVS